jgi:hypothetical protein
LASLKSCRPENSVVVRRDLTKFFNDTIRPFTLLLSAPITVGRSSQRVHFNTFGGNPVVCAQAGAVLDVIDRT